MLRRGTLTLLASALATLAGVVQAAPITPTFDSFGDLPAATFGGAGIPNDAVAITTIVDGPNTVTLGLTAHERFAEPPVGNNGAGTFSALAGGFPGDSSLARWNFAFYIDIAGGGTFADYAFDLLYDLDPASGTDAADHGVIDFNAVLTAAAIPLASVTLVEDSQNSGFGYLSAGVPGVTPPTFTPFDPAATGQYTFALRAFDVAGNSLGESAIQVNTVPEPISAALFGIGAAGMAVGGFRRRRRPQS